MLAAAVMAAMYYLPLKTHIAAHTTLMVPNDFLWTMGFLKRIILVTLVWNIQAFSQLFFDCKSSFVCWGKQVKFSFCTQFYRMSLLSVKNNDEICLFEFMVSFVFVVGQDWSSLLVHIGIDSILCFVVSQELV